MFEIRALRPLRGWDLVSHGRFEASLGGHVWTVDLDYLDFGEKLHLYRDGVEVEVQRSPARFDLGRGAAIEASMGLLGMQQVDLIVEDEKTPLTPVDGTAEAWRLRLARERPGTSRLLGVVSWVVLVMALVYETPQLIALLGNALGADFEPPITLPGAANFALGIAALAAASERALRFKSNRWLG
jgi:hypothetical protein